MAKTVWYGQHEIEVGSPVHKRLVEEGGQFTKEPVEFVDPGAGDADDNPYADLNKADLEKLAADRELDVQGTGKGGNVTVADLRAALDADDINNAGGTLGD